MDTFMQFVVAGAIGLLVMFIANWLDWRKTRCTATDRGIGDHIFDHWDEDMNDHRVQSRRCMACGWREYK